MGCGCNKNKDKKEITHQKKESKGFLGNLIDAGKKQPDKLKWFKEGVNGVLRAIGEPSDLTDQEIQNRRDICRQCPKSTKKDDKLTVSSQCTECGCSILLKTLHSENTCPLGQWPTIKKT